MIFQNPKIVNLTESSVFIIKLTYKKPLEIVDQYLAEHRIFLDQGYDKNYLIASGPQNPRIGGLMISQLNDIQILKKFLESDPYFINQIADYEFIEFIPVKFHPDFSKFISS